ncbi:MAG: hypothetical protein IPK16_29540 [Anaerolineales bacterium]|nr:hypothetical protein [Anaerolineales bacterium]
MSARTLTVFAHTGLSNRIYVLISGLALAAATGREFRMLWPRTPACGAAFHELFANEWPVEEVDAKAIKDLPYAWTRHNPRPPDLLASTDNNVVLGSHQTLVRPDLYPAHAALVEPCLAWFRQLQPATEVAASVEAFRSQHFRATMIGVHLRRGDYVTLRPDLLDNTAAALAAVEAALQRLPQAGIFLATDDGAPGLDGRSLPGEGVRERFTHQFGARVVWTTPRSLDRCAPAAVQDGLVDLWLLRQTDAFVGSAGSAFSRLATYGRTTPSTLCTGASRAYRRALWGYKLTGAYWLLRWLGRREFQRDLVFPELLRYYRVAPQRLLHSAFRPRQAPVPAPKE